MFSSRRNADISSPRRKDGDWITEQRERFSVHNLGDLNEKLKWEQNGNIFSPADYDDVGICRFVEGIGTFC